MFNKCNHEWVTVTDKTLLSPWQQLEKTRWTPKHIVLPLFEITHIHIMKCIQCGKIDKTITTST